MQLAHAYNPSPGDRRVPGTCWLASLGEHLSLRFGRTPSLPEKVEDKEMFEQSRVLKALERAQVQLLVPRSDNSQPPVITAMGELTSFRGLHEHQAQTQCTDTHAGETTVLIKQNKMK